MQKFFIEADSIAYEKMSGIGHATLELIKQLDKCDPRDVLTTLIVPHGTKKNIAKYNFKRVVVRSLPRGQRYINYALTCTSLPLPIELLYGRGIYIFPNYKNWPIYFSKSLTFVHDVAFKKYPETLNVKNLAYLEANFARWLARTDKIVSISYSSADELKGYYPQYADKISVVHLGVDPEVYYRRSRKETIHVCKQYDLPIDYFLYVGNIEPRKNIGRVIDAYCKYSDEQKTPKALVIVGGDGWNNDDILNKLDAAVAAGYRIYRPNGYVLDEHLPALYSGAHALIHVAIHEGFGLPPVQAQACGTYVIASELPVMKEVLTPLMAVFVPVNSTTKIASAMSAVPVKLAHAGKTKLTWKNTIVQIREIIDKMVKRG